MCAVCFWPDVGACTGGCFCQWCVPGWGVQGSRAVTCAGGTMLSPTGQILIWQVVRKWGRLWGIPLALVWYLRQSNCVSGCDHWFGKRLLETPMAGIVLSDICVINKSGVASHVSSQDWAESKVIRRGLVPPSLFSGRNLLEGVPVCMCVLPLCLCQWTPWHKQGAHWKRVAQKAPWALPGPHGAPCKCLSLPHPQLAAWAWLLGSSNRQHSAPCPLWGAWGSNSPAGDLTKMC